MYVLNFAVGHYDAATICEGVGGICLYYRYLIISRQQHQLVDMLRTCRELWDQLTDSEKVIVR